MVFVFHDVAVLFVKKEASPFCWKVRITNQNAIALENLLFLIVIFLPTHI